MCATKDVMAGNQAIVMAGDVFDLLMASMDVADVSTELERLAALPRLISS